MLLPIILLIAGLGNLTAAIWLFIRIGTFTNLILVLLSVGFTLSIIFIMICIIRPKSIMERPGFIKRLFARQVLSRRRKNNESHCLNPENAEIIMRNLRGIPYLIQAIQYSMETTCFSDNSNNVLRTAVIHTAPACRNVLEANGDDPVELTPTPQRPIGFEELWTPVNSSLWNNVQLNLSLSSGDSEFSVCFFT
uniref:G_PROTEIN_RECEP_F3_4 domain-containing protein n=1 Tax=Syphacia muris TaxID=451379 RepID=A0A0N5AC53_9BILA